VVLEVKEKRVYLGHFAFSKSIVSSDHSDTDAKFVSMSFASNSINLGLARAKKG
jgi:hypothetical protein